LGNDEFHDHATQLHIPVGFYGGSEEILELMTRNLARRLPRLDIFYAFSPRFGQLNEEEDEIIIRQIRSSGARLLFIGPGCPEQERWMSDHVSKMNAVMDGVGAAFDFIAGTKKQAPIWMQRNGLDWFFRILAEPKRLWMRYLYHNPRFVVLLTKQVVQTCFANLRNS
jgi:N-acetylglucosaminyldiphosphoundecaprenol N-acetyl-beta-D-mannosaminyltransferase